MCLAAFPLQAQISSAAQFLPVEQAYQLSPSVAKERVMLDWIIAPDYFLYRERIKVDATSSDGAALPIGITMSMGINKYDDYFERETEIYHSL